MTAGLSLLVYTRVDANNAGWTSGQTLGLAAVALVWSARAAVAVKFRQSPLSVLLHPLGMAVVLAIQWSALLGGTRRQPAVWRGRTYDV